MAEYSFHYDVKFVTPIRKSEREHIWKSLSHFLQEFAKQQGFSLKRKQKLKIRLKREKTDFYLFVSDTVFVGIHLERQSPKDLDVANELSNKISGFISSLSTTRPIKEIELTNVCESKMEPSVIQTFMSSESIANLASSLKLHLQPLIVGLRSKERGKETDFFVTEKGKKKQLFIRFSSITSEIPWDIVVKTYKDLNQLYSLTTGAIGVKP